MPEYLAPGVYLEEVDSGAKPIEGVSTSTAGMVGLAERGPLDVPILITSVGEYNRWFGGSLPADEFPGHCYLPHAVEGFFTNGGKRLYTVRVTPPQAQAATGTLFWQDPAVANPGVTVLLRGAGQDGGLGTAASPALYVLDATNLAVNDRIRVGNGSASEYMTVAASAAATQHVPLSAAVSRAHAAGVALAEHALNANGTYNAAKTLGSPAAMGATTLMVSSAVDNLATAPGPAADRLPWLVQLSSEGVTDLVVASAAQVAGANLYQLTLNQPLQRGYAAGQALTLIRSEATSARNLVVDALPGDLMVFGSANGAGAAVVELDRGQPGHEAFLSGSLGTLDFAQPLVAAAPSGTLFEQVTLALDGTVTLKHTTAALAAGTQIIPVGDRVGLAVGQVVRINSVALEEYATIAAIPGDRGAAPDAGTIVVSAPLSRSHLSNVEVEVQLAPALPGARARSRLVLEAAAGAARVLLTNDTGWANNDRARLTTPDGAHIYVRVTAAAVAAAPSTLTTSAGLDRSHAVGEAVVERQALFDVEALDVGSWGNRLTVSVQNEERGLAQTHALVLTAPLQFTVESLTGIEAGSLIELLNPDNGATAMLKVRRIDRANSAVILDAPGLTAGVLAGLGAIVNPLEVRSREFRLTVNLRRRPDPAVPSRNAMILQSETFASLSLDHRHSRYFQRVVGDTNGPLRLEDNRPEGDSAFVRVRDRVQGILTEVIRVGPETLVDVLPGGMIEPARHPLTHGDDSLATISDNAYLGADNAEPRLRTGLASLRNLPEISLIAVPGQSSAQLQAGVISHCENARYRFAVLDARDGDSSIADVRLQRQQFDSKYAALYYPWLSIPNPNPANLANIGNFALPPSGHVLGLIARVDIERGVHKAPANEVVRGITGLQRSLQKGEHDILNPSPTNINVIRDFRPDGRGIRLFGARCITSDQEHKYVNVRRLLIFLEQSIEQGLQWVVFEPNAEPLWARVTQSVSNFLTDVWHAGALEGTEPGQGFFVKCDLTTMTQSDIDNGRLICVVGVAPVKPAEFVIIRIGLTTRTTDGE